MISWPWKRFHWWIASAQWINTDGSRPKTYIAYDIKYNKIFLTGDINAYNTVYNWKPAFVVVRSCSLFHAKPPSLMDVHATFRPSTWCLINCPEDLPVCKLFSQRPLRQKSSLRRFKDFSYLCGPFTMDYSICAHSSFALLMFLSVTRSCWLLLGYWTLLWLGGHKNPLKKLRGSLQ